MTRETATLFDLPDHLAAKADPALVGRDEQHLVTVAENLARRVAALATRLEERRRSPVRAGQEALQRDLETHRLTAQLRTLRRFGLDVCLGRMVRAGDPEPVYVGRLGLTDEDGDPLLVDWRAPAAEPFFAATLADPMGLASRRRYRWTRGRVTDYWDEVFTTDAVENAAALDEESAFIAGLGGGRTERMRDVLATIQADQDAVIRADARHPLVVDGGPGTGKTVVALHRAAYLLYSDPRVAGGRGGVLFVGPHQPYLGYISDVLPDLGEDGVLTATLRDLVLEGAAAGTETDPEVARLKSSARMVEAVEPAIGLYEEPPTEPLTVETDWGEARLTPADWADAFSAPEPGATHNDAREDVWDALVEIVHDRLGLEEDDVPLDRLSRSLRRDDEDDALPAVLGRSWPVIDPADLVGDLWTVPAYLRRCAPWLSAAEVRTLQRPDPRAWTSADLPLLDAARARVGDPHAPARRRRREAALAAEREEMDRVVDHLVATDDSEMHLMSMLRGADLRGALVDDSGLPAREPDELAGPFAHVVVDEAQELTDAEWQVLLRRCPSRSLTVVGDRAQSRRGFPETWPDRLARLGLTARERTLTVNYRTPAEVMDAAEPVIRAAVPDANVPVSVRRTGVPVRHGRVAELDAVVDEWVAAHPDGVGCVVGAARSAAWEGFVPRPRVRALTPELAKGLEFDLVVLVEPDLLGAGTEGAVDRYVAMTRATERLVVLDG